MRNESTTQEYPDGLLQATAFTDNVTVTIKRVTDDAADDLISFTGTTEIQAFYAQRGVALGISQQTNVISLRVLAHDLMKRSQSQAINGLPDAAQNAAHARKLLTVAKTLKRNDPLLCSFTVEKPITL